VRPELSADSRLPWLLHGAPPLLLWPAAACRRPGGGAGECHAAAALRVVAITDRTPAAKPLSLKKRRPGGPDGPGRFLFLPCAGTPRLPWCSWCSPTSANEHPCSRTSPPSVAHVRRIAASWPPCQSLPLPQPAAKAPAWCCSMRWAQHPIRRGRGAGDRPVAPSGRSGPADAGHQPTSVSSRR